MHKHNTEKFSTVDNLVESNQDNKNKKHCDAVSPVGLLLTSILNSNPSVQ
jgi:hypothetical protein